MDLNSKFTRRDSLKLLGILGSSFFLSRFLNLPTSSGRITSDPSTPNIILLLFDTFSARHMSLYGYGRKTTPNIERFAKSSTVYHRNYSAASYTQSSTASILTGVYPWSHRSLDFITPLLEHYEHNNVFSGLFNSHNSITYTHNYHVDNILEQFRASIELLKPIQELVVYNRNVYPNLFKNDRPIGPFALKKLFDNFFGSSYSLFLSQIYTRAAHDAYERINNKYKDLYPLGLSERDGYLFKIEDAIDWIGEITGNITQPYFGYFHLLPPHETYSPRADFIDMFADDGFHILQKPDGFFSEHVSEEEQRINWQRYDEYIALVDSEFGRLLKILEENKTFNNTYLILTSDHGQLLERGIHGHLSPNLYESVIHTPLIVHAPRQTKGNKVYSLTSGVDLVPTILHLSKNDQLDECEGNILPILGGSNNHERIVFSMYTRENAKLSPLSKVTWAAIQWPYKLIHYSGYKNYSDVDELYNLENDPDELINLVNEKTDIVKSLKNEWIKSQAAAERKSIGALLKNNDISK